MIYAFSSGKFLNVMVYACVTDLTNIMSVLSLQTDYWLLTTGLLTGVTAREAFASKK